MRIPVTPELLAVVEEHEVPQPPITVDTAKAIVIGLRELAAGDGKALPPFLAKFLDDGDIWTSDLLNELDEMFAGYRLDMQDRLLINALIRCMQDRLLINALIRCVQRLGDS